MTAKITFIERKYWHEQIPAFSLEKVFDQVIRQLPNDKYDAEIVKLPYGNSATDVFKNLAFFKKPPSDIFHITGQVHYIALSLPKERSVLTIHDLGFLERHPGNKFRQNIIRKLYLDLPVGRLDFITAVSQATKKAIVDNTACSPEKIRVIHNPVQEHYLGGKPKPFNKEYPTVLQIGITENKNIPRLIEALKGIRCRLKIIGVLPEDLQATLRASGIDYVNESNLDDNQMKTAYEEADIVSFCSTYEGFGLPIIEAQAMHTPVLTSDIEPMNEVSGGVAYLADPFDVGSIRKGILTIIDDDAFREDIVQRGRENIERFRPDKIAAQYAELYDEMLRG